jgi:hypothetical protein
MEGRLPYYVIQRPIDSQYEEKSYYLGMYVYDLFFS